MAVVGRKLKPEDERRNRAAPTHEWTEVEDVPYSGPVPRLPQRWMFNPDTFKRTRVDYPARTLQWWSAISRMPHCVLWTPADWHYALDTVESHARFVEGDKGTELRIREKQLGNTIDARRDLRIRYIEPKPERPDGPSAEVVQLDAYRDL